LKRTFISLLCTLSIVNAQLEPELNAVGTVNTTQADDLVVDNQTELIFEEPPPLGVYPKRHTEFDGVTFEDTVTYLILNSDESA